MQALAIRKIEKLIVNQYMDNEVLKAIRERRSIRRFKADQITNDELKTVLEAGTWAPTGHGTQEPFIIAVQNPQLRDRLMRMNAENIFHASQSRLFQHVLDVLLLRLPAGVPSACCAPRAREAYNRYRAAVRRAASAALRLPEKTFLRQRFMIH